MKIAIVGGGITGVIIAAHAAPNARVTLYESSGALGGLHRSVVIDDYSYDIGSFFFADDHPVFDTFHGLRDFFIPVLPTGQSIHNGGGLDTYPLSASGYRRNHGTAHVIAALADLSISKWRHRRRDTLPSYCRYYLGERVYRNSGLHNYIERLYGLGEADIDVRFATERLAALRSLAGIRNVLSRTAFRRRPTEPRRFLARPRGGFQEMYDFIEADLVARGIRVKKKTAINMIARRTGDFSLRTGSGTERFDRIISTAPIPATARMVGVAPHHRFPTRSLLTLFYRYRGDPGFNAAALYNFSTEGEWKRITDFSKIYGLDCGDHPLAVEITADASDSDPKKSQLNFERHAKSLGILTGPDLVFQGYHLTPNAYPIYVRDGIELIDIDKQHIADAGIVLAGRQGRFGFGDSASNALYAIGIAKRLSGEPSS